MADSAAVRWLRSLDRIWAIGRRSDTAYLRFYPNPGFMLPWFGGRRLLWNRYDGWFTRSASSRVRPRYGRRAKG